ncbi:alpha/beta hydrolase [Pseudoflavitalea sp. G-6-1-2]|uniref:alpha/beta hydrolase n=1 Tax=Pseudoflavitalea sp. G-6-1-2 TaxID=2728841 RepID=UPI00146AF3F6|nr:alpha/beta fold hydrolase [Pseudoflavitalea sp. G-6-1-2]NML20772.1 alpha/beta hydrolase [Pseudoflavitalea sp. G-6-1-2]
MNRKKIIRWIKILVLVYCVIGILIYGLQDYFMFHPLALEKTYKYKFDSPYREVNLPFSADVNINVIQFTTKDSVPKGVVLYFHGNGHNIGAYAQNAPVFTRNGYEVWMLDYPGFGKSTGTFSEQKLYDWALLLYKLARAKYSKDSIILYGRSMGSGIAAWLGAKRDCNRLILETPYYSLPSIWSSRLPIYPMDRMIKYKLPTWEYLKEVTAPVVIFHGTSDGVIPYRNASKLKPSLKTGDEFVTIEDGGHNDLPKFPLYQQKMDSLLKK